MALVQVDDARGNTAGETAVLGAELFRLDGRVERYRLRLDALNALRHE